VIQTWQSKNIFQLTEKAFGRDTDVIIPAQNLARDIGVVGLGDLYNK